jgi:glycerophosphoryl diester phosphodiesterase
MTFRSVFALTASLAILGACDAGPDNQAEAESVERWLDDINLSAYLNCAREQDITLLQAHRAGDRRGAAENSIDASLASIADGAVFVEIDVARSSDGVLFLMHDDTLDRTTTGSGPFDALGFDALSSLNLVDVDGQIMDETIPTLAETLRALDGVGIAQIDRKRPTTFDEIADVLEAEEAVDRSVVITYTIEDAIALQQRLPEVMISVGLRDMDDVQTLTDAGVDLTRIQGWLGLGTGNPDWDAALAALEVETSYGDFRAERDGSIDYQLMADNGAEVISVDDVPAAADALDAYTQARTVLSRCPAALR